EEDELHCIDGKESSSALLQTFVGRPSTVAGLINSPNGQRSSSTRQVNSSDECFCEARTRRPLAVRRHRIRPHVHGVPATGRVSRRGKESISGLLLRARRTVRRSER